METAVLDVVKTEIAGIKGVLADWEKANVKPMREELDRIAGQLLQQQQLLKDARRYELARSDAYQRGLIQDGKYAGLSRLDLRMMGLLAAKQEDMGDPLRRKMLSDWQQSIRTAAAMDSTTATTGDELVPTGEASQLWMDVNLDTVVAPLIMRTPMPTNPFDLPLQLGDVNFYPGTENVATKSTAPTTSKSTLTAYELVGEVPWSYHLDEDSVVAMMPALREHMTREVAHILDDVILNADATALNGINSDGATITSESAGKAQWLLGYDGLIHLPLVDNTAQSSNVSGAIADTTINTLRKLMGKYAVRPTDCVIVTDLYTFLAAQTLTNLRTMDKFGPQATILTGQLAAFDGIPWLVSQDMLRADTDGKVTDAGNATNTGRVLIFNRMGWHQGFRREISMEAVRDTQKRQNIIVVSFRHALVARATRSSATHTALAYNITGI